MYPCHAGLDPASMNSGPWIAAQARNDSHLKPVLLQFLWSNRRLQQHHQELTNLKRGKLRFQGIEQRPDLRRVGHHTANQPDALGIFEFIGLS